MVRTFLCAVAAIITFDTGMASAATFDFRRAQDEANIVGSELIYSEGGVTLAVTAGGNNVVNARNGLGVNARNLGGARILLGETLTFSVLGQRPISSLISVVFERGSGEQSIDFFAGGVTTTLGLSPTSETEGASRESINLSTYLPSGTNEFSFIGTDSNTNQGFLISEIEIALVPVPAAILSLGTGLALLGGFGSLRRGSIRRHLLGKAAA